MSEGARGDSNKELGQTVEKFTNQCITFVRKHRYYLGINFDKYIVQLEAVLKCLHILHCLHWRTKGDVVLRVQEAITRSVREWYTFVLTRIICFDTKERSHFMSSSSSSSSTSLE